MARTFCFCFLAGTLTAQTTQLQPIRRGPLPPPPEQTAPRGTGSIEGTVSDAVSQAPLKKAQVNLTGSNIPLTAVTDASGRFAFRELAAGNYWLNASKQGYNPPQEFLAAATNNNVSLGDGEQKKGVEIALTPGGVIGGRVFNEEGLPVRGCQLTAAQRSYERNRRTLRGVSGGAGTNDKGEYRIDNLASGRYYVFAHCQAELPAAHPLLPRGDLRTPHETYLPQFYGGGLDPATATRLTVTGGASLENIDFRLTRVPAFSLHGTVSVSDPEALTRGVNVMLLPANQLLRDLVRFNSGVDMGTRKFQIRAVIPGSYLLVGFSWHEGRVFAGQRTVDIGAVPPDPVELALDGGAELKGSVEFDSDDHLSPENGQISLVPSDPQSPFPMSQPHAQMEKDGAFTFTGVTAGRWRLMVSVPGFAKSVSLAGKPVSPDGFQIPAGAAGPLRVVMGSKMADVRVEVTGAPADRQISVLIFPEDPSRLGAGMERVGAAMGSGSIGFGAMPPGRYRAFATDNPNPWPILQRPDWLKALEGHTSAIDVPEGGRVSATVEMIASDELKRVLEEIE